MKVATVSVAGERRVGKIAKDETSIAPLDLVFSEAQDGIPALICHNNGAAMRPTLSPIPLSQVTIEAPILVPRCNIFCVGKNYYEHGREFAGSRFDTGAADGAVPGNPIMFSEVPEPVIACGGAGVIDPKVSEAVDDKAELAVIIGKAGRGIEARNAFDDVWGYTIINDVTARDLQARHSQWLIGKSQDTFRRMFPIAVPGDEIDAANMPIECSVNGALSPGSNTGHLILDIPKIIETLSAGIALQPGDVIAAGTPAGAGIGFDPPKYPKAGDVARIENGGIGVLENEIVERPP